MRKEEKNAKKFVEGDRRAKVAGFQLGKGI